MQNKHNRVLWLLNHETLRAFEVPLLRRLGYEVYLPKIFPSTEEYLSGSVDRSYDDSLTIPPEALQLLNQHNFYSEIITPELAMILNRYFSAAIFATSPYLFEQIVDAFSGKLFLRGFGREGELNYEQMFSSSFSPRFPQKLFCVQDRFFFAQAYPFLSEVETGLCQKKALFLPLGMPEPYLQETNTWHGGNQKLLFVCPRIASSPYYTGIYASFKKEFSDIPHLIAGKQGQVNADPAIQGKLPREQYDALLRSSEVMFYHSEELRHLHYHPLEAIVIGLPLIFMRKGMLGRLVNSEKLPGACDSFKEAKEKINKILRKDRKFVQEVLDSQQQLLEPFQAASCEQIWKDNFVPLLQKSPSKRKTKKIAVFLPIPYRGGSLQGAKNIAKMIFLGSRSHGEPVDVVFSCCKNAYDLGETFSDLQELGISIRETTWERISKKELQFFGNFRNVGNISNTGEYSLPLDGSTNFSDCDFWLSISDRIDPPIAPITPYGVIVYDYIQRYIPELMGGLEKSFLTTARNASFVITTTPHTQHDAIQYAGIDARKVLLFPMEFSPKHEASSSPSAHSRDYFLWVTNAAIHKNHLRSLKALESFYGNHGGTIDVLMVGAHLDFFQNTSEKNPFPHTREIALYLEKSPLLKEKCHILGEVSDTRYSNYLSHAQFLWHPTLIDNGTFSVVEAAYLKVPSLSSDYPAMRYMDKRFGLNLQFFDPYDTSDMAKKLKLMESEAKSRKSLLPDEHHLVQFTVERLASDFWTAIRERL